MIKLVADIYYYVTSDGSILFTDTTKKIFQSKAESLLWRTREKIVKKGILKNNRNFSVKIKDGDVYVSHNKIQGGNWLKLVGGYGPDNIMDILESCEIKCGVVSGNDFEVAFLEEDYNQIRPYLVKQGTKSYEKAWDEFVRNTNILLRKKTKSLVVGNRYDIPSGSFWYLGEFDVPDLPGGSGYTKKKGFVVNLKTSDISVEDALKRVNKVLDLEKLTCRSFVDTDDTTLVLAEVTGPMTDSGPTMKDSDKQIDLMDIWEEWVKSSNMDNINNYIKLMFKTSGSGVVKSTNNISPLVEKVLEDFLLEKVCIPYESGSCGGTQLLASESAPERNVKFRKAFRYLWPGTNMDANEAESIIKTLGINMDQLFDNVISRFLSIDFDDFDNFYKYYKRFIRLDQNTYCRALQVSNDTTDSGGLKKVIHSPLVLKAVRGLIDLAKENLELVEEQFEYLGVYQYNKKQIPDINAKITIRDVVNYLGGIQALSDLDKAEILTEKFISIDLNFKRTVEFE